MHSSPAKPVNAKSPPSLTSRGRLLSKASLTAALPLLIVVIALTLRLYGINWDDGNFYHPDERSLLMRAECMQSVLANAPGWQSCIDQSFPTPTPGLPSLSTFFNKNASPLNPHWFPLGSILIYLLVGVRSLLGFFSRQVGLFDLAMAGRTMTALASTGSVLLMYFLGKRLFGRPVGLLASGLLAVTVIDIQLAHFYRPEPFIILLALAAFWWMLNVLERGRLRDHVVLGLVVGLSFAFKPTSLPLVAPLLITYGVLGWRRWRLDRGIAPAAGLVATGAKALFAGLIAFGTFALLEPYALLDFHQFVSDLLWETSIAHTAGLVPYTVQYVGVPTNGWYEIRQSAVWALGLPLGVVAWGGLAVTLVANFRRRHIGELLLLAWVVVTLATIVGFQAKFLRYVAPVLPVLVLLGSRWLIASYDRARVNSRLLAGAVLALTIFVIAATAFYALAFAASYRHLHPAVQASDWMNAHVAPGSVVLTDNSWDEGFPNLGNFAVQQLPMYDSDTLAKVQTVAQDLAQGNYIMAYSNRVWGSIARLPQRYPYSAAYYQALFSGRLGYQLVAAFARYPSLAGVTFVNDPFTRAGVPKPKQLPGVTTGPLTLNLGYADENVIDYDRPLVLVWKNTGHLSADQIAAIMLQGSATAQPQTAMLSPTALAQQQAGGTWTSIFHAGGLNGAVPWLVWLVVVEVVYLATLPLAVRLFRWLPDRGVVLARPLGLLLVAWLVWLGASTGVWTFSRASIALAIGLVAVASAAVFYRSRHSMIAWARRHWRYLLTLETLFIVAFLVFVLIRAANPDLWHPYRGGEKPMDLSFLTAVVKSTTFPPYDPWYAGGYINYYYFGFVIVGSLVKLTGIVPQISYNLAVPLLFALTLTGAFSVGFNLVESLRRRRPHLGVGSAVAAGLAAALLVAVLANVDGAVQLLQGAARTLTGGSFGQFDYWRSSRMISTGFAITEFPFWTFLFADLHAHLMSLPFQVLVLGLLVNVVIGARSPVSLWTRLPTIIVAAWVVGALAAINTWDVPAYTLLSLAALAVLAAVRCGRSHGTAVRWWLLWSAVFGVLLYVLWLPFHQHFAMPFSGLKLSQWRTPLWQYLAIHALLLFLGGSWLAYECWQRFFRTRRLSSSVGAAPISEKEIAPAPRPDLRRARTRVAAGLLLVMALVWFLVPALRQWTTAAMLAGFLAMAIALALWWLARRDHADAPVQILVLSFLAMAFCIGIGVDVVTLGNDIDRMNTVFKLYMNAWVLYGIAGGVGLWQLWASGALRWRFAGRFRVLPAAWTGAFVLLVLACGVFPILGTRARLADRFSTNLPLTLNGTAYQQVAVYNDPGPSPGEGGSYPLRYDAQALQYIREHVQGSPVFLEAVTDQYRWTPRVAVYTGLPVVVGWEWHEIQQRGTSDGGANVASRVKDVQTAYNTTDVTQFWSIIRKYGVRYVYVGPTERLYYSPAGIAKFDRLLGQGLDLYYSNAEVKIYRVVGAS